MIKKILRHFDKLSVALSLSNVRLVLLAQSGQVILVLLLVITIGLGVGLSVIGRSISDVEVSTKVEQSSRAFSAAEAGIEEALVKILEGRPPPSEVDFTNENQSKASITDALLPQAQQIFELPPISKENVAQVWLADWEDSSNIPDQSYYNQDALDIYWGDVSANPEPAIEISIIYFQDNQVKTKAFYFDPDSVRAVSNGFTPPGGDFSGCSASPTPITTSSGTNRLFACKATITSIGSSGLGPGRVLMLARAKIFYTNNTHSLAFGPKIASCAAPPFRVCSFPSQATVIVSTGTSGATQRRLLLFRQDSLVPGFFDYAIFSLASIDK